MMLTYKFIVQRRLSRGAGGAIVLSIIVLHVLLAKIYMSILPYYVLLYEVYSLNRRISGPPLLYINGNACTVVERNDFYQIGVNWMMQ